MTKARVVYSVGINDADYCVIKYREIDTDSGKRKREIVWRCPFYMRWKSMLTRCYSEKYKRTNPTYKDCSVCEEWLRFSNFKAWMETQDWEGKQLDKDLLANDGKVYSPETCCFISPKLNNFLKGCAKTNKTGYRGVHFDPTCNKYMALVGNPFIKGSNSEYLGHYSIPEDAYNVWAAKKKFFAVELAKFESDTRVLAAIEKMEWIKAQNEVAI